MLGLIIILFFLSSIFNPSPPRVVIIYEDPQITYLRNQSRRLENIVGAIIILAIILAVIAMILLL